MESESSLGNPGKNVDGPHTVDAYENKREHPPLWFILFHQRIAAIHQGHIPKGSLHKEYAGMLRDPRRIALMMKFHQKNVACTPIGLLNMQPPQQAVTVYVHLGIWTWHAIIQKGKEAAKQLFNTKSCSIIQAALCFSIAHNLTKLNISTSTSIYIHKIHAPLPAKNTNMFFTNPMNRSIYNIEMGQTFLFIGVVELWQKFSVAPFVEVKWLRFSSNPFPEFPKRNNPLRFETTKCSKQRVEQSSARTLFPKCVHKLGSPRFFLEAVFLNNGYCRSCSESSSGSCSFFKWFSFFPIHEMSVVGLSRRRSNPSSRTGGVRTMFRACHGKLVVRINWKILWYEQTMHPR